MIRSVFQLLRARGGWLLTLAVLSQLPMLWYRHYVGSREGRDALIDVMNDVGELYAYGTESGNLWLPGVFIILRTVLALLAFALAGRLALSHLIAPQRGFAIPEVPIRMPMLLTGLIVPVVMGISLFVGFVLGALLGWWVLSFILVLLCLAFGGQVAASTVVAMQGRAAEYALTGREGLPVAQSTWGFPTRRALGLMLIAGVYYLLPAVGWRVITSVLMDDPRNIVLLSAATLVESVALTLWIAASVCAWYQQNADRFPVDRKHLEETFQ